MIKDLQLGAFDGLSLRDSVYETLKKNIMVGDFAPGERLMEIPLANMLGVSRTPVREAIKRLAKENLVVISPGCGAKVADITNKDVTDALDVRIHIEEMAVRLAAANITKEQMKELKFINNRMSEAIKNGDYTTASDADNRLHRVICEAAGNNVLTNVHIMLEQHVLRYRIKYIQSMDEFNKLTLEHIQILNAIEQGNGDEAAELIKRHIENQREIICEIIENQKKNK